MANENRILVLEGYDTHPYAKKRGRTGAWCARKVGRKRVVERLSDPSSCSGEVVYAKTKKAARKQAFGDLGARRSSGGRSAAQNRFARAAHVCARQHGGGRKSSYLTCMKEKLSR